MIFEPREGKTGDIVRIKIGSIYHYGVFIGEDEVIQFGYPPVGRHPENQDITVCVTDIDEFSAGYIVEVGVLDKKEQKACKKTKDIVSYARSRVGQGGYNLVHNNCEHFVNECVFGSPVSNQELNAREKWKNRKILDVYISKIPENLEITETATEERQRELESITNENLKREKFWVWQVLEYASFRSFSLSLDSLAPKKEKNGKWISDRCFFSLSHTNGLVAVAISNAPVGVDVENAKDFERKFDGKIELRDKMFDKLRAKGEEKSESTKDLMALWTKKESVFKKSDNKGVFKPQKLVLKREKILTKIDSLEGVEYCLSVCGENAESVRYHVYGNN